MLEHDGINDQWNHFLVLKAQLNLARSCSTLVSSIKGSTVKIKSTKSNTPHQLKIVRFNSYQTPSGSDYNNNNNSNNKYSSFPDKKFTEDEFDNLYVTFQKITHDESLTPYQMNDAVNRLFDAYHMEDAGLGIGFGPTILTKYAKYLSINYTPEESRAIFTWIGSYQVLKKAERFNMPNLKPSPNSPFTEKHYDSFFNEWLMIRQNDSLTEEQKKDYYETLFDSYRLSEPESEGDMNLFMKFIALRGDGYANDFVNQFTKYTVRKGFSSALNFFGLSKNKSTPPPPPPPSSNENNGFSQKSSPEQSSQVNESQSSNVDSQEIPLSDEAVSSLLKEVKRIYSNDAR
ncbi:unnamed protein product [Ambrosiozyma monospora]|uniref:Unnamed protein product n=1 Tax=Ambrosiozyma monospora TaxID=43982 RepID=A0ACB5TAN8_AMBMO|nr:unnamed protein product [Ambrosiozyma monospora]